MRTLQRSLFAIFLIEYLDEFVFGVREAAWPQIRDSLALSYTEIGLLLSVPPIVGNIVEPLLGLFGGKHRRVIISVGGLCVALATALCGIAPSFAWFLIGSLLFNPASGAFVSLSQASLMDADPAQRERNMARWTLAGSLGVVSGPLCLGAAAQLGLSWRHLLLLAAALALGGLFLTRQHPLPTPDVEDDEVAEPPLVALRAALTRPSVLRYVLLLELADLLADVLFGFLALYLVDVLSLDASQASLGVLLWTLSSLLGDVLVLPVLARVESTAYLRASATLSLALYALFLCASSLWVVYGLLSLLGLCRAGWYSILMARLYDELPGRSGVVLALINLFNFAAALIPLALGLLAERYGLRAILWLLATGPLSIVFGVQAKGGPTPSRKEEDGVSQEPPAS